jgi:hypothetical protein
MEMPDALFLLQALFYSKRTLRENKKSYNSVAVFNFGSRRVGMPF